MSDKKQSVDEYLRSQHSKHLHYKTEALLAFVRYKQERLENWIVFLLVLNIASLILFITTLNLIS